MHDVIVMGAGHDGLAAAATLGRAGKRVLVLERKNRIGGRLVTEEVFPGFKVSPCVNTGGRLRPQLIKDLCLSVDYIPHDPLVLAPLADGKHLSLWRATRRTMDEIARFSPRDANTYPRFLMFLRRVVNALEHALDLAPPSVEAPQTTELVSMARVGVNLRLLGDENLVRFMRMGTMPLADFLDEWFETDVLKAAIAGLALQGTVHGPRAPGTASLLILANLVGYGDTPRGGMGAVPAALLAACRAQGVEVRTGAEVTCLLFSNGAVSGVRLANGEEIPAARVLAAGDPREACLKLVPPEVLPPTVTLNARNFRTRGRVARINLALKSLPEFACLRGEHFQKGKHREGHFSERLRGRIHFGGSMDALERAADDAKYGRWSKEPVVEMTIPTIMDPGRAPNGQHVAELLVQSAPYGLREGDWNSRREEFADDVLGWLETFVPGLRDAVLHRQVLTPLDLEQKYGLSQGHLQHGDHGLEQLFFLRPMPGTYRYATPLPGLYLCGAGTHPGAGVTAASGANAAREVLLSYQGTSRTRESVKAAAKSPVGAGLMLFGAGLAVGAAYKALTRKPNDVTSAAVERRRSDDTTQEDLQV